jgi:DNA-binding response OmpR family regulator
MASARVLVVDDEEPLRHLIRLYLEKEGWAVVEAADGREALDAFDAGGADLAVVDVMLPGVDGLEVVRRMRRTSHIPIILLTARGEEANRVAGLAVGADDYVVKPFSMLELVARVRAQLRRAGEFSGPAGDAGPGGDGLRLDRAARRCEVAGHPVTLTRREFDLLCALLDHAGHALSREQLLGEAWGTTFISAKTVDVHVASLRKKLGGAVQITALRGVGYRLDG